MEINIQLIFMANQNILDQSTSTKDNDIIGFQVDKKFAVSMMINMYINEPCRICGKIITKDDLNELIFTGYSECSKARAAHGSCWKNHGKDDTETWEYP